MLPENTFLGSFGFSANPFTMTNADEEPELQSYFVPPPYFASVLGDPKRPKSAVVFAPRGGGKTAQKVMIEKAATSEEVGRFLCVTYDTFILPNAFSIENASTDWHLTNIIKLIIVALLIASDEVEKADLPLNADQKNALAKTASYFLSELTEAEFRQNIVALRNWRGNADYYWNKYGGKIANLITAIASKFDIGSVDKLSEKIELNKNSIVDYIHQLTGISKSLGFESVYILVDRIDETSLTSNNARTAFDFIKALLSDLHVLEMDGMAYKFFLWDKALDYYYAEGARPDRIPIHDLDWTVQQLGEMLEKRLLSFSQGKINSLNALAGDEVSIDIHRMVCFFAAGSPRDMIRLSQRMVDEQTRTANVPGAFSNATIEAAVRNFSNERSLELYPQFIPDLRRIGLASFTITKISSDIFRVTAQAGRSKVQKWQDWGAVEQTGEVPNPGNRPYYLYSVTDPRLVIVAKGNQPLMDTLEASFILCECEKLNFTDVEGSHCSGCGRDLDEKKNLRTILSS